MRLLHWQWSISRSALNEAPLRILSLFLLSQVHVELGLFLEARDREEQSWSYLQSLQDLAHTQPQTHCQESTTDSVWNIIIISNLLFDRNSPFCVGLQSEFNIPEIKKTERAHVVLLQEQFYS